MDEVNQDNQKSTCPADKPPSKEEMKEQKRREKRGLIFITVFVVLILAGVAGALLLPKLLQNDEPKAQAYYTYNGYDFAKVDGTWLTHGYRGDKQFRITLRNGPRDLENISVKGNIMNFRAAHDFYYITFDPREENHDKYVTMSMAELTANFRMHFGKNFTAGCTVDHPDCRKKNTSVITCENTDKPVVYLKRKEGRKITVKDNCAVIQGKGEGMVDAADRFLYGMYGIMR